jgi:hypothetical protein
MKKVIEKNGRIYIVYKYKNKEWVYDITEEELWVLFNS